MYIVRKPVVPLYIRTRAIKPKVSAGKLWGFSCHSVHKCIHWFLLLVAVCVLPPFRRYRPSHAPVTQRQFQPRFEIRSRRGTTRMPQKADSNRSTYFSAKGRSQKGRNKRNAVGGRSSVAYDILMLICGRSHAHRCGSRATAKSLPVTPFFLIGVVPIECTRWLDPTRHARRRRSHDRACATKQRRVCSRLETRGGLGPAWKHAAGLVPLGNMRWVWSRLGNMQCGAVRPREGGVR